MKAIAAVAAVLLLSLGTAAYGADGPGYTETVALIQKTMADSPSIARKESYNYIRFDKCIMSYNVLGTFPVGDLYNLTFSNLDFSSLNPQESKFGHDYTAFISLNFGKPFRYATGTRDLSIHTTVVNVSNDANTQLLFKAFLHLGELCKSGAVPR